MAKTDLCGLGDGEARRAAAVAAAAMGVREFDCDVGAKEACASEATVVENGPVCVGVRARVVAAMKRFRSSVYGWLMSYPRHDLQPWTESECEMTSRIE